MKSNPVEVAAGFGCALWAGSATIGLMALTLALIALFGG